MRFASSTPTLCTVRVSIWHSDLEGVTTPPPDSLRVSWGGAGGFLGRAACRAPWRPRGAFVLNVRIALRAVAAVCVEDLQGTESFPTPFRSVSESSALESYGIFTFFVILVRPGDIVESSGIGDPLGSRSVGG